MSLTGLAEQLAECPAEDTKRLAEVAAGLAAQIQLRAKQLQSSAERRQQAELDRLIQQPRDKATLMQMTDQAFRSRRAARAADQLAHILDIQGIPRFFNPLDRTMLRGFQSFGGYLPGVAVPLVKEKMRHETANVILPAERELLANHLEQRNRDGIRMNVNLLGEAILGEREAERRLQAYLGVLQLPEVECVSIKISTLYSQISTVAREQTVDTLMGRLELLYRAAARYRFRRRDGSEVSKFVYLDMEEYRDMQLTGEVFMRTLDSAEMADVRAGIALQAYVPDSYLLQQRITQWARRRVAAGGCPITVRIVKGANMEMERVEASLRGWPQAPYQKKVDTDANYKRMIAYGMSPENAEAVHLGVGSHNLFDMAFAMVLAAKQNVLDKVQFEMLEGMANHQRRALREIVDNLLLYAPACRKEDFVHAIGYLVRRMDENTGSENFLRHAFKIEVDGPDWRAMESIFYRSIDRMSTVEDQPRRSQNRLNPPAQPEAPLGWRSIVNEPDTDFSLPSASQWAKTIVQDWEDQCDSRAKTVLHSIGQADEEGQGEVYCSMDPSRPGVVVAKYPLASADQLRRAVECAAADPSGWAELDPASRYQLMRQAAQCLRRRRADLMGAAMAEAGKILLESDPEVSEAVDFVEFYAKVALDVYCSPNGFDIPDPIRVAGDTLGPAGRVAVGTVAAGSGGRPRGPMVVISPWNFPIAIPCGGIAAALAVGNPVILKPSVETGLVARILCECFWEAGIPRSALQLAICHGPEASDHLLSNPLVSTCVFTGGTETALKILEQRPDLHLLAETGGKNATIVSSLSDRDLAIKNILHSAFSHSGQKCSATSLLLLEEEVYHDPQFLETLRDGAESLRVGSAWDLRTKLGPLIRPPRGPLLRGLKELEPKEEWVLMPKNHHENPCLYSPGIKRGVQPRSFTHLTELFGPVLAVMKFRELGEAIELVHQNGYGLTGGLESLDDREQEFWASRIKVGNLYINRSTTGAIVLRQPFGGMGKSAFGPGVKAGGPNYLVPLMSFPSLAAQTDHAPASGPAGDSLAGNSPAANSPAANPTDSRSQKALDQEEREKVSQAIVDLQLSIDLLAEFWSLLQSDHPAAVLARSELGQFGLSRLTVAIQDYDRFGFFEIRRTHDTLKLIGQDNIRRYQPVNQVRIRLSPHDAWLDLLARALAVAAVGGRAAVSKPPNCLDRQVDLLESLTHAWAGDLEFVQETDSELIAAIRRGLVDRIRYSSPEAVPADVRQAANREMVYIADQPISELGRVELLWYVREQSLCVDYHRYGNLGFRAEESRAAVL
jgi:RHH-type transcriptional regulator, proline utilization regulon repressor / proline dehydrogenase / delta 1-pyrroline-5-carboxylate dehydrogenase